MSRCVEVLVRVYPEGIPGKDAKPGDPLIAEEEGMIQVNRFVIDDTPKDFCKKIARFIWESSNKSVSSCRENRQAGGFPIPEEEQVLWCKYL